MNSINGFFKVLSPLAMPIDVAIGSEDDALAFMRDHADLGWSPAHIPDGGYVFPYDMAEDFDFRLIGARTFCKDVPYGTQGKVRKDVRHLVHRGFVYQERSLDEDTSSSQRGAAKIKFSRGAKPTDPPHLKEAAAADKAGYITLISFVGKGRVDTRYLKPKAGRPAARVTQPAPAPAPARDAAPSATQHAAAPAATPQTNTRPLAAVPVAVNLIERWAKLGRDRNDIKPWLKSIGIEETAALTDAQKTLIHNELLSLERSATPTIGKRWEALGRDKRALTPWIRSLGITPPPRGGEYTDADKETMLSAMARLEDAAAERAEYERAAH
jgi:hypothetical protein